MVVLNLLGLIPPHLAWGEQHDRARNLFETSIKLNQDNQFEKAVKLLNQLREIQPILFRLNNGYYLLGRCLKNIGNYTEAIRCFRETLKRNNLLAPYARYDIAECLKELGMYSQAIMYLKMLDYKQLNFKRDQLLAQIYRCQNEFLTAIKVYKRLRSSEKRTRLRRQIDLLIGKTYEEMGGQEEKALLIYYSMLDYGGLNNETFQAINRIEQLEKSGNVYTGNYPARHLLRGKTIYKLGMYSKATEVFSSFIEKYTQDKRIPEAYFLKGRCLVREESFLMAIKTFQEGLNRFPEGKYAKRSRYQMASCYFKLGDDEKGKWQLMKIMSSKPKNFLLNHALFELGQYYERKEAWVKALRFYKELVRRFPRNFLADNALWNWSRILIRLGKYGEALKNLKKLTRDFKSSDLYPEARIWIGICYAKINKTNKALKTFREFLKDFPFHFYANYANDYMTKSNRGILDDEKEEEIKKLLEKNKQKLAGKFNSRNFEKLLDTYLLYPETKYHTELKYVLEKMFQKSKNGSKAWNLTKYNPRSFFYGYKPRNDYWNSMKTSMAFKRGLELYSLGDLDRGFGEIEKAWEDNPSDITLLYNLAYLANKAGRYNASIKYSTNLKNMLGSRRMFFLLPNEIQKLVYPLGFSDILIKYAGKYKLEFEIVAAIIYQESKFDPNAVSPASAKGLMQIIPRTGNQIAQKLELKDFNEQYLHNPQKSIQMGCCYFRQLLDQFNNRVEIALASYNGGPHNSKRWMELCKSNDPLEFIGAITFRETRNYVKIVLGNYHIYKKLYANEEQF